MPKGFPSSSSKSTTSAAVGEPVAVSDSPANMQPIAVGGEGQTAHAVDRLQAEVQIQIVTQHALVKIADAVVIVGIVDDDGRATKVVARKSGLLAKGFDAIMLILMRKAKHVLVTRSRALASFTSEAKGV